MVVAGGGGGVRDCYIVQIFIPLFVTIIVFLN